MSGAISNISAPLIPRVSRGELLAQGIGAVANEGDYERQAEQSARQLVSTVFVQPLLDMATEGQFAAGAFARSAGEKRFLPMLNQHLADRIVEAGNLSIVDAVKDRLLRHHPRVENAYAPQEIDSDQGTVNAISA